MKNILVTGGLGFIGSNFIPYFLEKSQSRIINLDKQTYAGSYSNLQELENHPHYEFIHGDITNRELLLHIFRHFDIQAVIHFAAESHVDNSIQTPEIFVQTNVLGTFQLLDVAQKYWMSAPFTYRADYQDCRFIHISTDEVYGSLGAKGYFTETTPHAPNSPYSASKSGADMIARSYYHTYGLNVITTNSSNNYGPRQHREKFIPTIIRSILEAQPIPIYGDGQYIRDWIYVLDHCKAIDQVFREGKIGETYNVGANNEINNVDLVEQVCEIMDRRIPPQASLKSYKELIHFVKDRPGHDRRYAIDSSKLQKLGWQTEETFANGLEKTIEWYCEQNKL